MNIMDLSNLSHDKELQGLEFTSDYEYMVSRLEGLECIRHLRRGWMEGSWGKFELHNCIRAIALRETPDKVGEKVLSALVVALGPFKAEPAVFNILFAFAGKTWDQGCLFAPCAVVILAKEEF